MRFFGKTILFAAISLIFIPPASAQISLDDLPAAQGNGHFVSDEIAPVKHLPLTINEVGAGPVIRALPAPALPR